jgi:hypothetical protein
LIRNANIGGIYLLIASFPFHLLYFGDQQRSSSSNGGDGGGGGERERREKWKRPCFLKVHTGQRK